MCLPATSLKVAVSRHHSFRVRTMLAVKNGRDVRNCAISFRPDLAGLIFRGGVISPLTTEPLCGGRPKVIGGELKRHGTPFGAISESVKLSERIRDHFMPRHERLRRQDYVDSRD